MKFKAIINERGNGFPDVGDYVPGEDGNLWRVTSIDGSIQTGSAAGVPNWVRATVQDADWSDCEEGYEFPASAVVETDDEEEEDDE